MKKSKSNYNNPYRPVPNRIGNTKGRVSVFNEPKRVVQGRVEEIEYDYDDMFEDDDIVITFSVSKFIFWFLIISVICALFS